jgi:hypothetical protein
MFGMSVSRRLFLCRVSLVLVCFLPMVVGAWILAGVAGGFWLADKGEWERVLTERLGLAAQIDEVRYSRLGVAELVGVRLVDAESQAVVVETSRVEIAVKADGWQIAAERPVILGDQLDCLARVVGPRILESRHAATVWMAPCDVLIKRKSQEQSLEKVAGEIHFSADKTEFEVSWQLPGAASAVDLIRLVATRDRAAAMPVKRYRLDTGKTTLPCRLAAELVPELANLGRECQFRGAVECCDAAGEFSGQLSGTLTQVDLDSLVTERFGHQLSGLANVRIERGLIENGKLSELRGTIQASDGAISRSLVLAAAEHLGLNAADEAIGGGADERFAFGRLAMEFQISGAALRLRGTADAKQEGILLVNAAGPILTSPPKHSVAAVSLLRTLLPDREYQVPATRQTAALVSLLPVPDASSSRPAEAPLHTPTRLLPATAQPAQAAIRQPVLR